MEQKPRRILGSAAKHGSWGVSPSAMPYSPLPPTRKATRQAVDPLLSGLTLPLDSQTNVRYTARMDTVHTYTDGSSLGNPGPAGWAVLNNGILHAGHCKIATNNTMEMYAAIQALVTSPPNAHVVIHTDSQLIINWLSGKWKINKEHIRKLAMTFNDIAFKKGQTYAFEWVKGHGSSVENVIADSEARRQANLSKSWSDRQYTTHLSPPSEIATSHTHLA